MNIEFELKKNPSYKTGKFLGFLYFLLFFFSVIYSAFWILRPYISYWVKHTPKPGASSQLIMELLAIIVVGVLINLQNFDGKFFKGLKAGFGTIPHFVSKVVNFILLSIVYLVGLGPVAIIGKLTGKSYLDLKKSGSTWVDRSKDKKNEEDIYRQF